MIPVYRSEILDGLSDKIKNSGSLAYCAQASKAKNPDRVIKALASKKADSLDLYPFECILVSTGWNQNTDVFDRAEVWAAKDTPENKPLNYEHNDTDIIGHITKSWAIDLNNIELDSSLSLEDVITDDFHIANASVLYKVWQNKENTDRIEKIIAEIEEGLWFVSMECIFRGFDYALMQNGENKVIARNEQTAFLTKYLRQYGGTGEYNNAKIGRVLRNIVFCGKGLVKNPANPNSVIFANLLPFANASTANILDINKDLVYINSNSKQVQEKNMSEPVDSMKVVVDELKASVALLTKERDDLKKALSEIDVKAAEAKVASLDAVIKTKTEEVNSLSEKLEASKTEITALKNKLEDSESKVVAANKQLDEIKQAQVTASRSALLKDKGVPEDQIEKTVKGFAHLNDETFALIVSLMNKSTPVKEEAKAEKDKDDVTTQGSLDDVVSDDAALAVSSVEDTTKVTDDIAKFFNKAKAEAK